MANPNDALVELKKAQERAQKVIDAIKKESEMIQLQKSLKTSGETKPSSPTKPLS